MYQILALRVYEVTAQQNRYTSRQMSSLESKINLFATRMIITEGWKNGAEAIMKNIEKNLSKALKTEMKLDSE